MKIALINPYNQYNISLMEMLREWFDNENIEFVFVDRPRFPNETWFILDDMCNRHCWDAQPDKSDFEPYWIKESKQKWGLLK